MHRTAIVIFFLLGALAAYHTATAQQPSPTPSASPALAPAPPGPGTAPPPPPDNEPFLVKARAAIAGHETEPASKVFKNVQMMKDVPAGRLLDIMNGGYSRALGVSCTHCHVETDFASDDKRPKRAAREMMTMTHALNDQIHALKALRPLETGEQRAVNCGTCHRGHVNPAEGSGRPRPPR